MTPCIPVNNENQLDASEYNRLRGYSPGLAERLVRVLGVGRESRLLDIGCGTGKHTALVAGLGNCTASGVDIDPIRIAQAREYYPHIEWSVAAADELPFKDSSYSAVQILFAVQRFRDMDSALHEAYRVLRSKGQIAVVTVSHAQLNNRLDLRFFGEALECELRRFPSVEDIAGVLGNVGFTRIKAVSYVEPFAPLDKDWLEWVKQKPYSSLRTLPEDKFVAGLSRLRNYVGSAENTMIAINEATIISAGK